MEYRSIDGRGNSLSEPHINATDTAFIRLAARSSPTPGAAWSTVPTRGDQQHRRRPGRRRRREPARPLGHDVCLGPVHRPRPRPPRIRRRDPYRHHDPGGRPDLPRWHAIAITRAIDPATGDGPRTRRRRSTRSPAGSTPRWSTARTPPPRRACAPPTATCEPRPAATCRSMNGDATSAGDVRRVNENPSLTALQTLFVREHNFQVDRLHDAHPGLERRPALPAGARHRRRRDRSTSPTPSSCRTCSATDAIGGYQGYDPTVDPRISLEFAGAAFRFGHSIVSAETERLDENGEVTGDPSCAQDTFFQPPARLRRRRRRRRLPAPPRLRPRRRRWTRRIVDDLRNFLFDPPAAWTSRRSTSSAAATSASAR